MKRRPSEDKLVKKYDSELQKLERKIKKEKVRFASVEGNHKKKVDSIHKEKMKIMTKISIINDRVRRRCKHKGGTHLRYNPRDDVTYTHRVICDDCGEQIGTYGSQTAYG